MAFVDNSLKRQGAYTLYMNSTCSSKIVPIPGDTAQESKLATVNQLLLDVSQPLAILPDSAVYVNLDSRLLDGLKKNQRLPVMMGSFAPPVCTRHPKWLS